MDRNDLYLRLYPSYLVILLVCVVLITVPSSWLLVRSHENEVLEQLTLQAMLVRKMLPPGYSDWDSAQMEDLFSDVSFRLTLIREDGLVLFDNRKSAESMENHLMRPEIQQYISGEPAFAKRHSATLDMNMLYFVRSGPRWSFPEEQKVFIRLAHPLEPIYSTLSTYLIKIFFTAIILAVIAIYVSYLMGRRLKRSLKMLEQKASVFAEHLLEENETNPKGIDPAVFSQYHFKTVEFEQLSNTMDRMANQLLKEIDRQREQFQRHQVLLKSMVEAVLSVDMDGRVQNFNQAAVEMFQLVSKGKIIGEDVRIHLRNPMLLQVVQEVLVSGEQSTRELEIFTPMVRWLEVKSVPLKGIDGAQVGMVMVGQDLTGTRALSKMRKDFVANVSHELKTPITAIKGFVETLLGGACQDPKDQKLFLTIVLKHADRMTAIIDDLLSLSRLEGRGDEFELIHLELRDIVDEAVFNCREKANKKGITMSINAETSCCVEANALLLEQAILNLLDNAIKYSPAKTQVIVRLTCSGPFCQVDVVDQGEGILEKYHSRLFERFFRVDKARSKKEGGTGLGLSIVKHILALHGGQVFVESKKGEGSTFSIRLPGKNNCCNQVK